MLSLGAVSMCLGVALIGQVSAPWQLYPCFVLIGIGWSTLSTTGITATVAPWFERHQGRSMTLAIMGASVGAIAGVPLLLLAIGRFGLAQRPDRRRRRRRRLVLLPLIGRVLRFRGPAEIGQRRDGDQPPLDEAAPPLVRPADRHARQPARPAVERRGRLRARPHGADRLHHPSRDPGRAAAGHGRRRPAGERHRRHGLRGPPGAGAHRRPGARAAARLADHGRCRRRRCSPSRCGRPRRC